MPYHRLCSNDHDYSMYFSGISQNMFFINHRGMEKALADSKSRINVHEAKYIVELSRHFILQGYKSSEITILATYSGQLAEIKKRMACHTLLKDVLATTVDNYQGEENEIILLSFVRSNRKGNIGFLKTENRVNVALSRARKGLYAIGNFDFLFKGSQIWKNIVGELERQNAIGNALEIYCQNHPNTKTSVQSIEDFKKSPEGGCLKKCSFVCVNGHSCKSFCHIIDAKHIGLKKCLVLIKTKANCGHTVEIECAFSRDEQALHKKCKMPCKEPLKCGHLCSIKCGECKHKLQIFKKERLSELSIRSKYLASSHVLPTSEINSRTNCLLCSQASACASPVWFDEETREPIKTLW